MRTTPQRTLARIALLLVVLMTATGCGTSVEEPRPNPQASGPIELPYNPDPPGDSRIFATLVGDPGLDGGCVYLRQGGTDFSVLWPEGFTAEFDPLRLYDANGSVVAEEGDQIELSGTWAVDPAAYRPRRCSVGGQLWLAGALMPAG